MQEAAFRTTNLATFRVLLPTWSEYIPEEHRSGTVSYEMPKHWPQWRDINTAFPAAFRDGGQLVVKVESRDYPGQLLEWEAS